ncbi:Coiled-coil domain-containing protein 42 [Boothiomyces sp. JEL0838]|nr:Coiled-coil domain-containing protein 42 [Boothiomyces sp. JEL0838]
MTTETDRDLAIKRIGEYLLKGWVLTDVPCRNCQVPTLRTKDKSQVDFCTLCDLPSEIIQKNDIDDSLLKKKELEYKRVLDMELNEPKKETKSVSELLGKYLLKGWTMMQECCDTCEGVPYMRNKKKELYCVSCEKYKKEDSPAQDAVKENVQSVELQNAKTAQVAANADLKMQDLQSLGQKKNDPSNLMGQLLIQGWTMLDSCCKECNVPLMKKGNENLCVSCNNKIQEEDIDLQELELEMPAYKSKTVMPSETPLVERVAKRVKTEDILLEKIEELGTRLAKTTRADEIIETCKAIESCASAIKSLRNLK